MTPRVHVRWTPLPAGVVAPDAVQALLPLLSAAERERFAGTADESAAGRFVVGRAAIRMLASELLDGALPPAEIVVSAHCAVCGGPHGRPEAELRSAKGRRISLSIAHCAAGVAVAAMWRGPVGIDVEPADATTAGLAAVSALIPSAARPAGRNWEPVQHWTRMEAALKADGRGLTLDPAEVRIASGEGAITATLPPAPGVPGTAPAENPREEPAPRFAIADLRLDPAVRASVAIGLRAPKEGKSSKDGKAQKPDKPVVPVINWKRLPLDDLTAHRAHPSPA